MRERAVGAQARGVDVVAICVSEGGLTQPMADEVAALFSGLCDDLMPLLAMVDFDQADNNLGRLPQVSDF
jgi:hypothetical protein